MDTKIIFIDFDNTLFSHTTKSIPESTYVALEKLKEKGILTCLCTGRCQYEVEKYFELPRMKFDYYIYFNGQQILDKDKNTLFSLTIEGIDKQNAIKVFNEKKIPFIMESKDDYYINFNNDLVYKTCVVKSSSPLPKVQEYIEDDLYMASFFPGEMEGLDDFVKENFPNCNAIVWDEGVYDLLLKCSSKANGIKKLIEILNIKIEDTMSFGDGRNDIEMLDLTGMSVAMGNSSELVQSHAKYVTDDIDHDGIYNALVHFSLI